MIQLNAERETRLRRATAASLALAEAVGWPIERTAPILSHNFRYVAAAELLLVPSIESFAVDRERVGRAMREARCEALVVAVGLNMARGPTLYASAGLWSRRENEWHPALMVWVGQDGAIWLVPDPHDDRVQSSFRLSPGRLRPAAPPWTDLAARDAGLERADDLFAKGL